MAIKRPPKIKREMVLLGVLLVVLVFYVLHTFVFSGPDPKSKPKTQTQNTAAPASNSNRPVQTPKEAGAGSAQEQKRHLVLDDRTPLNLQLLVYSRGDPQPSNRGNIFDYYHEPPKKVIPPKPPPITISYLQPQTAVAGTPRAFTLTVSGRPFPADAQIIIDGRPRQTKRVNEGALSTEIPPAEYSTQRSMNVEVKSLADQANWYSNPMPFMVMPSPDPPFRYVGRIGETGILEMNGTKELARVTRGSSVQGVWRIESVREDAVEVLQTQYEIRKRVVMQDKGR